MKSIFSFFKRTKIVFLTMLATLLLILFCSALSISHVSGFSQMISHIQSAFSTHKALLIVSHILVFSAIFLTGFWGFKQSAKKKNVPEKQIKAFGWLMAVFLLTVLMIDGFTFIF